MCVHSHRIPCLSMEFSCCTRSTKFRQESRAILNTEVRRIKKDTAYHCQRRKFISVGQARACHLPVEIFCFDFGPCLLSPWVGVIDFNARFVGQIGTVKSRPINVDKAQREAQDPERRRHFRRRAKKLPCQKAGREDPERRGPRSIELSHSELGSAR